MEKRLFATFHYVPKFRTLPVTSLPSTAHRVAINAGSALSDIHSHQPPCPRHHPTGLHYPTRQSPSKRSVVPNHARLPPCDLSARCHARQHYKAYENQKIQDEHIVMKLDMQCTYLAKHIFPHSTEQCADKWVHQSRQPTWVTSGPCSPTRSAATSPTRGR